MPAFRVSTGLHVEHRRPSAGDVPHEGLLKVSTDRRPIPSEVPVYKGTRVYLTKIVRKEDDYVNGMLATVENYPCGCRHAAREDEDGEAFGHHSLDGPGQAERGVFPGAFGLPVYVSWRPRLSSLGFRVRGLGFRVWSLGF